MKIWLTVSLATNHGFGQLFIAPKGKNLRDNYSSELRFILKFSTYQSGAVHFGLLIFLRN